MSTPNSGNKRKWNRPMAVDTAGAAIAFLLPAAAAVNEFPYMCEKAAAGGKLTAVLHLSGAALVILALLLFLTARRFLLSHLPHFHSGLPTALLLYVGVTGVETFIGNIRVILFYAVIGTAVELVFSLIAKRMRAEEASRGNT